MNETVRTTCPYCGTGCGLEVQVGERGEITSLRGDALHPANFGRLCGKGMALPETMILDGRLLHPRVHGQTTSWDQALDRVADGFKAIIAQHGPDAVAFYVSGQLLTEDYYVANKLMKGFIGSANIDSNSRLCMASAVVAHKRAFGADRVPCSYEDIELAELVVIVGSNTAWCHPILFQRLLAARRADTNKRLVVIDPRRTATAMEADLHLPIQSGTDLYLWLGLLVYLQQNGGFDLDFLRRQVEVQPHALELAAAHAGDIATVARRTGLSASEVEQFYSLFLQTRRTVTLFSQGINQSCQGSDQGNAIINCHLATGRIGEPGMGPFSLTGQPNAMGGREVGALANQLAAHLGFDHPRHAEVLRRFWGSPALPARPGPLAVDLFRAVGEGRIRALWILGTNPLVSLPDSNAVRRALDRCELLVVSDVVDTTDTARMAHILLPALPWGEKEGTVTNSERRISRQRAFLPAAGSAKPDWWMLCQVAKRLGHGKAFAYESSAEIFREHAALSAFENEGRRAFDIGALARISEADYHAMPPQQWPLPQDGGGSARWEKGSPFFTPSGRACLMELAPAPDSPAAGGELILNTGRIRDQWHTMTRTGVSPTLSRHTVEPVAEVHPDDARQWGVAEGQLLRLTSAHGTALARTQLKNEQRRGSVFMSMHWSGRFAGEGLVNALVTARTDPFSGQPDAKRSRVRITPVNTLWRGILLSRDPWFEARPSGIGWSRQALEGGLWLTRLEGEEVFDFATATGREWIAGESVEWVEYRDAACGRLRLAALQEGRLQACLFIESREVLPDVAALMSLFGVTRLDERQRLGVLSRSGSSSCRERAVCACAGVSAEGIRRAVAQGLSPTVEAIGKGLKAGVNCGSCQPEIRAILANLAA
ncbi:MAG: nitrate reductase [Magnetococcales bacterium]|nr:nitrate reductase [Magnetococcales bacterium]